jgi:hypothetical protein
MPFLNIPLKTVSVDVVGILGIESMPWFNPVQFPVTPGSPQPTPVNRDYRWRVTLSVENQQHSSYLTRNPGIYNGLDITVGQWISNINTGQAWQIINIESKTETQVVAIVQDIYRYNTFRDPTGVGDGGPTFGTYIVFNISDTGLPQMDPIPDAGVSLVFTQNLQSRFEYINLQFDYPLFQFGNNFQVNDVIAVDQETNNFVLSSNAHKIIIGRVTSISDTIPGWFTINPVQKVVDFLNYLPGDVGDTIYTSVIEPGGLSLSPDGAQIYIKLRNNTQSRTVAELPGPTSAGNVFQLNGIDIEINNIGSASDVVTAINSQTSVTGVAADLELQPTEASTDTGLLSFYGEVVLDVTQPAVASINGFTVVFDIESSTPGYSGYTQSPQMALSINLANIPNIVATAPTTQELVITNIVGGPITIVNISNDNANVPFAGPGSGSGIVLVTPSSSDFRLVLTAEDARSINLLNVVGDTLGDFGLVSVENGVKAAGLYVEGGLRTASTTVVADLAQLNSLSPLIGDQAYVIDSDDGAGNAVGEWSTWLYDGSLWVQTANQDSAQTDAKSMELLIVPEPGVNNYIVGQMSTNRRITLITVEVTTAFDSTTSLAIGYSVSNPLTPETNATGLMSAALIDLSVAGTYTVQTDILFGTDTAQGDVTVTAQFTDGGATQGSAQIIVSYV